MLRCKGPNRSWHLQMITDLHFHNSDHKFNFYNPEWPIVYVPSNQELTYNVDDVLDLLANAGSLIQEVFGMNFWDIVEMDRFTYSKFKKKVMEVYERRLKDQEEQEAEAERQRREEELQRQREEQQRNRENR